jgi:DNA-binding transcriptional regulator GbsR (MarR family)
MSEDDQIPPEVRKLIHERIHSIEALEVLLMLYRQRARAVALDEMVTQLRIGRASVEAAVSELESAGLATRDSVAVGYRPTPLEIDQAVASLLHTYENFRVETLVLISSNAIKRVRNDALRTFAEAFRLGGKKTDG